MLRDEFLARLRGRETWDLIVIGGGATGLGTAADASARGYKTLLLEAYDFAKGTSSRSTKLVHGGVRYLQQGDIPLVREALRERGLLARNAPHLVHALPFVVPAYEWWARPYYGIGLMAYDLLSGRLGIGRSKLLSRTAALDRAPTLEPEGLRGGILYYDGQFDDARLAVTLALTAMDHGGVLLNYMRVTGLLKQDGRISGVGARDEETGEEFEIEARGVVNATGVFADEVRRMDDPAAEPMLSPSQGVHIVLDRSFLPGDSAVMIPRTADGRVLFAVPWHGRVLVGTTDTPRDTARIEPRPLAEEIDFLLKHTALYFSKDPRPEDVLSVYAGLRPLVREPGAKNTAQLSRSHVRVVSDTGLVTMTGGKWTTYRQMAEDAVDGVAEVAGLPRRKCPTVHLKLHGWDARPDAEPFTVYGSDAARVRDLCAEAPGLDRPLHPNLPYRAGEVVWAVRHEMARTVEDVLSRRLRALLLDEQASVEAAPRVAELLAHELGRDTGWQQAQVEAYQELARGYHVEPDYHAEFEEMHEQARAA